MQEAMRLEAVTLEEFEAMAKNEKLRYELIDGAIMMSPRPNLEHQNISLNLATTIRAVLGKMPCRVLQEIELRLDQSSIIPDLSIICDNGNSKGLFYDGIPLIVMEILSPSTARHDFYYKLNKYHDVGISEYWIVDPKTKGITVHDYANQTAEVYIIGDVIQSLARPEIIIAVADIFA